MDTEEKHHSSKPKSYDVFESEEDISSTTTTGESDGNVSGVEGEDKQPDAEVEVEEQLRIGYYCIVKGCPGYAIKGKYFPNKQHPIAHVKACNSHAKVDLNAKCKLCNDLNISKAEFENICEVCVERCEQQIVASRALARQGKIPYIKFTPPKDRPPLSHRRVKRQRQSNKSQPIQETSSPILLSFDETTSAPPPPHPPEPLRIPPHTLNYLSSRNSTMPSPSTTSNTLSQSTTSSTSQSTTRHPNINLYKTDNTERAESVASPLPGLDDITTGYQSFMFMLRTEKQRMQEEKKRIIATRQNMEIKMRDAEEMQQRAATAIQQAEEEKLLVQSERQKLVEEVKKIELERTAITEEKSKIRERRQNLVKEKEKLDAERKSFEEEMSKGRENLRMQKSALSEQHNQLKRKLAAFQNDLALLTPK